VGEVAGDEKLTRILGRQLNGNVLAKRRRTLADINSNVNHRSLRNPDELGLRELPFLEVQTAEHTLGRHRLVRLNKLNGRVYILMEFVELERFHEITAIIAKTLWLNDIDTLDRGF
jgi:hypothetical protein